MKKFSIVLVVTAIIMALSACIDAADWYDVPEDYIDETVIPLNQQIDDIKDAYEFSADRVDEWAKYSKLRRIEVYFLGDQIEQQRGTINYIFITDDGVAKCLSEVTVTVDMESSSSTSLSAWYDARSYSRRNRDGTFEGWDAIKERELDMSNWTLTLDDAFEIIYETLGYDAFSRFENPKITLDFSSESWIFNVTKETETAMSARVKHWISINPITKQVIEITGFEDSEL